MPFSMGKRLAELSTAPDTYSPSSTEIPEPTGEEAQEAEDEETLRRELVQREMARRKKSFHASTLKTLRSQIDAERRAAADAETHVLSEYGSVEGRDCFATLLRAVEECTRLQLSKGVATTLRNEGFRCARLPSATTPYVQALLEQGDNLFKAESSVKATMTVKPPDVEDETMKQADGHLAAADLGYRTANQDQFLDMRVDEASDGVVPLNATTEGALPGLQHAAWCVLHVLMAATRGALRAIAADLELPEQIFLEVVESESGKMPGACLRLCQYAEAARTQQSAGKVAFSAHTDTTVVTLAMCALQPGLEIRNQKGQWVAPEVGRDPYDILVMPGEFIETLTKGYLRSSLHRVTRSTAPRLSMPFLVRAKPKARINTKRHLEEARAQGLKVGTRVLDVEGVTAQWLWSRGAFA